MHPLAVDLFMVLSGFLMVLTWRGDFSTDKLFSRNTVHFYINRFFRIAPLYFFLLIVCYFFLTPLATIHDVIAKAYPPPWVTDLPNYNPTTSWSFDNLRWLVLHLTFMYGALPGGETTPLPDWSLSLEMQFYLVLPVILLMLKHIPIWILAIVFSAMSFLAPMILGNYLDSGWWAHFGQPSALPYRLNAFLAGMIPALWLRLRGNTNVGGSSLLVTFISAFVCVLPLSKPVILLYGVFNLIVFRRVWGVTWFLSSLPITFLGKISYSIYLCHLLIVTPVVFLLSQQSSFGAMSATYRFGLALAITAPIVIGFSYLLWRRVESSGIQLGRNLTL